ADTTINEEFNKGQPAGAPDIKRTFTKPEVMVHFKCDVHPWMRAYVGVVAHPFFTTSRDTGDFELPGLPPGEYVLEAWHERLGQQFLAVTVADGERVEVVFRFPAQ